MTGMRKGPIDKDGRKMRKDKWGGNRRKYEREGGSAYKQEK
jgi:hypothetical protein